MSTLDEIEARADKATAGPWRIEKDREEDYEQGIPYSEWPQTLVGPENAYPSEWSKRNGTTHQVDEISELKFPDAEFIASAREDVPRLLAALRAVEALHVPGRAYEAEDDCGHAAETHDTIETTDGEWVCLDTPLDETFCEECRDNLGDTQPWPCPTITAIREVVG
jgi:hypothetical protein